MVKKVNAKLLAEAKKKAELDELRRKTLITDQHYKPLHQLCVDLNTHRDTGLESVEDVSNHEKKYGSNVIARPKEKSIIVKILEEQVGGFSFVLWLAALCHLYAGYYLADQESRLAGATMIVMSIATGLFLFVENYRVKPDHQPQYQLEENFYVVRRHARERRVQGKEIVVGDILLNLSHANLIPADCRILACDPHTCVNNTLFGAKESSSLRVSEDDGGHLGAEENPMDSSNMIWRGTDITNKGIVREALVLKTGKDTQAGRTLKLLHAIEDKMDHQSFTRREIGTAATLFSVSAITIMIASVIYIEVGYAAPMDSTDLSILAASVLVACIPMGLLLSTMLTLRTSYSRMAAKGIKVKDVGHIEVMGGVSAIVTQPQGPLSNGHEKMAALVYVDDDGELKMTIPPSPYNHFNADHNAVLEDMDHKGAQALQKSVLLSCTDCRFVTKEEDTLHTRWVELKEGSATMVEKHAYNYKLDEVTNKRYRNFAWGMIGEETDCAAVRYYYEMPANFQSIMATVDHTTPDGKNTTRHEMTVFDAVDVRKHYPRIFWSPFEALRGFEISIRTAGPGEDPTKNNSPRVVFIKGNPESVIARCRYMRDPHEGMRPITDFDKKVLDDTVKRYSSEGLKVVAYAESEPLPLAKYSHAYNYSVQPGGGYITANFPLGEDEDMENVHPRSTGGLIFNGMICVHDEAHDLVEAVEDCRSGGIRIILTTAENAENGLGLARKVGIVTEENTDLDLTEHNEIIRNIVGTDASIEANDYSAENDRLASLPDELQDAVTQKMSEMLTMPVEEIIQAGLNKFINPDSSNAAIIVADKVWDAKASEHRDLEDMDTDWWERLLRNKSQIVIARCRPIHRQILCLNLQRLDHTVALTGMGPEDAVALEEADIGITTPDAATMVQSAADVILDGGHFIGIVELIKEGRLVYENLKKTTAFLTTSNVPQMAGIFANVWLQLPLPINATLVLLVDLVTNMIPSIAMAGEPAEKPLMHHPPRNIKTERILTFKMIFFSYFQIGVIQAFAGMYAYFVVMADFGFSPMHLYEGGPKGNWGNAPLYCKFDGGNYVNTRGEIDLGRDPTTQRPDVMFPLWDSGDGGTVEECVHPIRNFKGGGSFSLHATPINIGLASSYYHHKGAHTTGRAMITVETLDALEHNGFYEYIPFKARMSSFWQDSWLSYDITQSRESLSSNQIPYRTAEQEDQFRDNQISGQDVLRYFQKASLGLWSICLADPMMEPAHHMDAEEVRYNEEDGLKGFASTDAEEGLFVATSERVGVSVGNFVYKQRHDHVKSQLPTIDNSSAKLGTTGCRRGVFEKPAEIGSMYAHALFCNGDQFRVNKQQFFEQAGGPLGPGQKWEEEEENWKKWRSHHNDGLDDEVFLNYKKDVAHMTYNINDKDAVAPYADVSLEYTSSDFNVTGFVNVLREKCALLDDHHHQLAYCRGQCHYECERMKPNERFNMTGELTDLVKTSAQKNYNENNPDEEPKGFEVYGGPGRTRASQRTCQCANIASRMVQKEALYNARTAFLVAIVFCQMATVVAFKTRWLSVIEHGLGNPLLNVGLFASLMAMALATYSPMLNDIFSTRPIRFYHWMPGLPWACVIIVYDELRKFFMRKTSSKTINEDGSVTRVIGWLEANTHY